MSRQFPRKIFGYQISSKSVYVFLSCIVYGEDRRTDGTERFQWLLYSNVNAPKQKIKERDKGKKQYKN